MNHEGMEGSVIVITGGGSGMGAAMAKDFAERGAGIAILDLDEARGSAVADSITDANGKAVYKKVDVTDKQAVLTAADEVEQELGASRDVLTILENYKRHAGPDFARELDVLTADMRSSSYEAALVRFEGRLASPMLSDIVRGLIGVLRGDDGRIYFQMLSHDMKQLELQRLKAQAAKIPPKIRVYSFVMLVCFMLIYIVVILMQILTSMGGLFG